MLTDPGFALANPCREADRARSKGEEASPAAAPNGTGHPGPAAKTAMDEWDLL